MMELSQEAVPDLQLRVSPRLIAANHILEMSSQELQQEIAKELDDNPALDMVDMVVCPTCGQPIEGEACPRCTKKQEDSTVPDPTEQYLENLAWNVSTVTRDEDFDPLTLIAAQVTLEEKLLADLGTMVSEEDMPIAEYLVGSLDADGYLRCSTYEVCVKFEVEPERVEHLIAQLQTLEPPGIGARDVQECMVIQLRYLAALGVEHPLAIQLVQDHLEDLGKHKFNRIAREIGADVEEVEEAWEFIKSKLNPHPAQGSDGVPTRSGPRPVQGYVMPDVIITTSEDGKSFEVEVIESRRFALSVNSMYQQLLSQASAVASSISQEERDHIQHYVSRAKMFIANINQRRQTMQKITSFLVEYQQDFLAHGVRHLRPLTRALLAERTGIHESTVSRATAAKYVMLPSGEVIPFSDFFTASLSVKDIIKDMIAREERALTDQEIALRLRDYGYNVARRTVAKYRDQLDILPSSLR
jgi:RNA polymerase sigma-54 factor